jgi:UDP-N-acetyl-2-amino-2-deoxyglucuronate dehydrogenase
MLLQIEIMKNFLMIGAAGYIAPRHMKAIKDTGNNLIAALDKFDSVGIIDSYFPDADFFTEFERFDRHVEKLKRNGTKIDYVAIASPNYLHDAHIRFGLRHGADVICEKPLVLNPWNIDALLDIEKETGRKVNTILQLRLHDNVIALKKKVDASPEGEVFDVEMTYITARGNWYHTSWKGDEAKSGGIATNIGVHFFDMLQWVFGDVEENYVHLHEKNRAAGFIRLKKANVRWFLSIDENDLPLEAKLKNQRTFRSIFIDDETFEFSDGFTELHTRSYQKILNDTGFSLQEARKAVVITHDIRNKNIEITKGEVHPFLKK